MIHAVFLSIYFFLIKMLGGKKLGIFMAVALNEVEFEGLLSVGQGMMYSLMVGWGEGGTRHSPPMRSSDS